MTTPSLQLAHAVTNLEQRIHRRRLSAVTHLWLARQASPTAPPRFTQLPPVPQPVAASVDELATRLPAAFAHGHDLALTLAGPAVVAFALNLVGDGLRTLVAVDTAASTYLVRRPTACKPTVHLFRAGEAAGVAGHVDEDAHGALARLAAAVAGLRAAGGGGGG